MPPPTPVASYPCPRPRFQAVRLGFQACKDTWDLGEISPFSDSAPSDDTATDAFHVPGSGADCSSSSSNWNGFNVWDDDADDAAGLPGWTHEQVLGSMLR